MQPSDEFILAGLAATDAVVYLLLVLGLRRTKADPVLSVGSLSDAFQVLERALRQAFPDLPEGFTWTEGISKARKLNLRKVDWEELGRELETYEAHRYGGAPVSGERFREALKLAVVLPKRRGRDLRSRWWAEVVGSSRSNNSTAGQQRQ